MEEALSNNADRHEKKCEPVNLFKIARTDNVDQKHPQISQNIKKLPTQRPEHQLCPQNLIKNVLLRFVLLAIYP
jgi:hypothetical protein